MLTGLEVSSLKSNDSFLRSVSFVKCGIFHISHISYFPYITYIIFSIYHTSGDSYESKNPFYLKIWRNISYYVTKFWVQLLNFFLFSSWVLQARISRKSAWFTQQVRWLSKYESNKIGTEDLYVKKHPNHFLNI